MAKFRIIEQFRRAIEESDYGNELPKLAKEAKYDRANLINFMERRRAGMSLESFARICQVLGLELHKPETDSKK